MKKPTIIVVAYNRPLSLKRILSSLKNAKYDYQDINLVISIDKYRDESDKKKNEEVYNLATLFDWKFGVKEVIYKSENLGLKKHIIECGNLTARFENIILLEDDLFVSPFFYDYSLNAINFYENNLEIAGISLFNHCYNETARFPFKSINDGNDVYFMQLASSWGQIWNFRMWKNFCEWFEKNPKIEEKSKIPKDIKKWSSSSWKKHFIHYIVENDLYFVYPKLSLTTNFMDAGTHHSKFKDCRLQTELLLEKREFKFIHIKESKAVYDVYCELKPEKLKEMFPELENFNLILDLYGKKEMKNFDKNQYIVTSKKMRNPLKKFGLNFKPHENNIIFNNEGEVFSFGKVEDIISEKNNFLIQYQYFYITIVNFFKDYIKYYFI